MAVVGFGGFLVIQSQGTVGDIVAFQMFAFMLLMPVSQIVNSINATQQALAAMERVFEILERKPEKPDPPDALDVPETIDELRFESVEFEYVDKVPVLSEISFTVPAGSTVALVGPSGAGQLTKMVNQICVAGLVQGLSEGIHFAKAADLDIEAVMTTLSKGAAQSWQMENRWRTMANDEFEFGFAVDLMRKDLAICLEEARTNGAQLPITEIVDRFYGEVQDMGGNRWDTSSLIARLDALCRLGAKNS